MLKLLHAADLHLSESTRDHGLEVLGELVYHARRLEVDGVLLAGDIFDSPAALGALGADFRAALAGLEGIPALMIPGNHELSGGRDPATVAETLGGGAPALTVLTAMPFAFHAPEALPELEVLAAPFRREYGDYLEWRPPPKARAHRIGLFHGVVHGMCFTGDSGEDEQSIIDPDMFGRLELDYVALGHIHARRDGRFGECLAHYPGSARVWRRGEEGPRMATLVRLEPGHAGIEPVTLETAGAFHAVTMSVGEDGALLDYPGPDAALEALAARHGPNDWVEVTLDGLVESATPVDLLAAKLRQGGAGRFRRMDVEAGAVREAAYLNGHPLVMSFNAQWRPRFEAAVAAGDRAEADVLRLARRMVLEEIEQALG